MTGRPTGPFSWLSVPSSWSPRPSPGDGSVPRQRWYPVAMREAFPLAIANGVLVVAYFGLAHQFFQLRFGRRGSNYLALFLFLIWGVPLVVGTISLFANFMNSGPSQIIYALSPVAGLGLATGVGEGIRNNLMAVEAAAITPSLLYTFVFNNLVTSARRRVQKAVLISIEKTKQPRTETGRVSASHGVAAHWISSSRIAAVHGEHRAGDETGLVRSQEQDGGGDLLRAADPAHRVAVLKHLEEGFWIVRAVHRPAQHRRVHRPRADTIHADALRRILDGKLPGKLKSAPLLGGYGAWPGMPVRLEMEPVITIEPPDGSCLRNWRTASRQQRNTPFALTPITRSQSSSEVSTIAPT